MFPNSGVSSKIQIKKTCQSTGFGNGPSCFSIVTSFPSREKHYILLTVFSQLYQGLIDKEN